jgi:hypothetical protein
VVHGRDNFYFMPPRRKDPLETLKMDLFIRKPVLFTIDLALA